MEIDIDIDIWSKIFNLILNKLKFEGIKKIIIENKDNYWIINSPEWTVMTKIAEPDVGSFLDDWDALKKIAQGENPTTFVDFDRCSALLRLLSEELNPIKE